MNQVLMSRRASSFAAQKRLKKSRLTGGLHADSDRRPAALVCRAQAEGRGCGQPWCRYAELGAARARRQPARAGVCGEGRKTRGFRRDRAAQQQCLLRDNFCGVEVRRDAALAVVAAAARRGRRGARNSKTRVGGRCEADWNAPNSVPAHFVPEGFSDEPVNNPVARYWKAMTSGGSTGRPKVILDHHPAVVDTTAEMVLGIPRDVSLLNPGPLYHNAPFILSHTGLFAGGRVTGMIKFDAEEALRLIAAHRVQWVNFVPTMMHRIWALPEEVRHGYDLSSLQIVFHMAAPMPPWLKEKWIEWLGPERIWELYGGTERQGAGGIFGGGWLPAEGGGGGGRACVIAGVEWLAHKGSVGRIGETARLRIIGEDGNDVASGETGEIYFLPNDGAGSDYPYLGAEPKRRADGWESLGDIGRLDADGYLYLGDRLAGMILRGGANISPAEVEAAVMAHPKVRSCVVVGLPDPEFGQRVHAILELNEAADPQSVADGMGNFLSQQLSRYKHPESFEIVSVGLRDDSGKVRRTLLRDERAAWLKENRAFRIVPA